MKLIIVRTGAPLVSAGLFLMFLIPMQGAPVPLPTFTKITSGPASIGSSSSLAWGDYNNDGFVDLYVNVFNVGPSILYSNNANGTFSKVTNGNIATDQANAFGAAWADYDNDGSR